MTRVAGIDADEPVRQRAALAAARLAHRYPAWNVRPVRVHGGWSVEAVPDRDDGRPSAVIGTAAEVEAALFHAGSRVPVRRSMSAADRDGRRPSPGDPRLPPVPVTRAVTQVPL